MNGQKTGKETGKSKKGFWVALIVVVLVLALPLEVAAQTKQYTIGYGIYNGSHPWAVESIKFTRWVAKCLNVKLVISFDNLKLEDQIANVENFVSSKVDGVLILPVFPTIAPRVAPALERAKIAWGTYDATLPEDVMKSMYQYKYFIGYTGQSNAMTGVDVANFMLQQGKKNAVILAPERGFVMHEERVAGFVKAFKEGGGKVLAIQWNCTNAEDSAKVMESLLSAYPTLDCAYGTGDPVAIGAVEALRRHNLLGKIAVAGTDMSSEGLELFRKGDMRFESGGHWADGGFALIRLYNVLTGNALGTNKDVATINLFPLRSQEDASNYQKLMVDRPSYSEAEIRNLVKLFNPNMTFKIFQDALNRHGIQDTYERRTKDQKSNIAFPPLYSEIEW